MNKKVSVIIVNYNGKKYLPVCLRSIQASTYKNLEVIVVDNASVDGSVEYIRKHDPKVKIVQMTTNTGFAGGNIAGIKEASGEYLLLLNNDTRSTKDLVAKLVEFYEKTPDCGVIQPKIRLLYHPEYLDGIGSSLTVAGFLAHHGHKMLEKKVNIDEPQEIFVPKGACMFLSKKDYVKAGGFDNKYFIYFEETDLCWRIYLMGKKNYYYPGAVVYHAVGRTSSKLPLPFVEYHSFKNRIATLIKNLENGSLIMVLPIHLLLVTMFIFLYIVTGKFPNAYAIVKAMIWNITNLPYLYNQRKRTRRIRMTKDNELFRKHVEKISITESLHMARSYFFKRGKV